MQGFQIILIGISVYTLWFGHTHVVVLLRKIWDPPQRKTWSFFKETNGATKANVLNNMRWSFLFQLVSSTSDGKMMFRIACECSVWSFFFALVMSSDPEIPLPPCLRQKMKLNEYLTDKEQDGRSAKECSGEDGEPVFYSRFLRGTSFLCAKDLGSPVAASAKV